MPSQSAELDILAKEIKMLFVKIFKQMRREVEKQLAQADIKLSPSAFGVLHLLRKRKQLTIKDLGDHLMIRPATLVPVIDALEKNGLIRRQPDKDDRRRNFLILTPAGEKIFKSGVFAKIDHLLSGKLEKIGLAKSRQLFSLISELATVILPPAELAESLKQVKS
jgi:DNA-binding MarR family transcriptional regulator